MNESMEKEKERIHDDLLKEHLFTLWVNEEQTIDADTERLRLMRSLRKNRRWLTPWSVAASCLLLIAAGTALLLLTRERIPYRPGTVEPVSLQAVLFTSDGQAFHLTDQSFSLLENNGTRIRMEAGHGMSYTPETVSDTAVLYNRIEVPRGGEFAMTLSDGTQVWLNAETEFRYPVHFTGDLREVSLRGEAYFRVTADSLRPFVVRHDDYRLAVLGTEFNLNTYRPEAIEAALVSGKVSIAAGTDASGLLLSPGSLATTNLKTGVTRTRAANLRPYTAWINKDIIFNRERLDVILERIARWYDVDIYFRAPAAKEILFDINIPRYAEIEDFFYLLEKTSEATFSLKGKTVIVDMDKK